MKCEIHVEITISQTYSNSTTRHKSITTLRLVLQGKYRYCNTHRFVRQFKRFLSYSRMVGPNGVPARPWLVLILKKRARVLRWRAWYAHQATPTSRASAFQVEISGGQNSSPRKFPSCPRSIMTTDEQRRDALVTRQRYLPCRARFNSLGRRSSRSPVNCIAQYYYYYTRMSTELSPFVRAQYLS